jgi:hypothetical protein
MEFCIKAGFIDYCLRLEEWRQVASHGVRTANSFIGCVDLRKKQRPGLESREAISALGVKLAAVQLHKSVSWNPLLKQILVS